MGERRWAREGSSHVRYKNLGKMKKTFYSNDVAWGKTPHLPPTTHVKSPKKH